MNDQPDKVQLRALLAQYHAAMVEGHTGKLEAIVAPDFTLTHITGYVQPKYEWFGVVRSRQFDYHQIDVDLDAVDITVQGHHAEARGRGVFHATINGMRAPWRLAFTVAFSCPNGIWQIASARYRSY